MSQNAPRPQVARRALAVVLALFVILGTLYSVVTPIFEASDELWHYPMVEVIARTWQLPVQPTEPGTSSGPWRQEGSQPPLYYALGAVLTFWIDTSDLDTVRQPNPHARAGEITPERDNVNLVIHNPAAERFPWSGTVLAVHLVRLLSVALGAWAVFLTWALVRELFPAQPWLALAASAVHAFTPMYLFVSSSVNNDNLIVPLSTLALLLMVRRVKLAGRRPTTSSVYAYFGLGVVIGLGLLTKASGIALVLLALAALAWETWRLPRDVRWVRKAAFLGSRTMAMLVPAIAIAGWWFVRNVRLYGDWLGFNAFYAVLGTRDVPATLAQLWAERFAFASGYWGNFGGLNVPMPRWVVIALNWIAIVAAAGLMLRFGAWLLRRSEGTWAEKVWPFAWSDTTAAHALAWAFPAGVFISWTRWATITWSSQGRLVFTAISMWSLALVLGLTTWLPERTGRLRRLPGIALAVALLGLCVVALPAWIAPAYRPPQTAASAPTDLGLTPLEVRFGDDLELLGYAVDAQAITPGQPVEVRLMWRALGPTSTYRSIFLHVLGEGDRIVAQRDSFPGHGLLPTTQLSAGRTWVERHLISIPRTAYVPDELTLAVGVYETSTGSRTLPTGPSIAGGADTARFGDVALTIPTNRSSLDIQFGDGIVLEGYNLSSVVVAPGEDVSVTLNWLCTGPVPDDYTVSVQIIDAQWHKAAQLDSWPLEGQAPTSSWQVGQRLSETRVLAISSDAVPGAYDLRLSLYRPNGTGELLHLPVSLGDAGMPSKDIVLTAVRVR